MKIVKLPNKRVQAACGFNAKNNNELNAKTYNELEPTGGRSS